jgi:hypothetical protein
MDTLIIETSSMMMNLHEAKFFCRASADPIDRFIESSRFFVLDEGIWSLIRALMVLPQIFAAAVPV